MTQEKGTQEEKVVDETTDLDLGQGLDEFMGETKPKEGEKKVETKKAEEKKPVEEPTDNAERSQLGRKVKGIEDSVRTLTENLNAFLATQNRPKEVASDDEIPQYISTPDDLEKYNRAKAKKEQAMKQVYESNYVKMVRQIAGQDDDGDDVMKEVLSLESPFNRYITGDPVVDARINYADAARAILKKKYVPAKAKPNVKGEKSQVSTSLNITTTERPSEGAEVALDDFAKEFINQTKMKDESVKEALGKK